MCSLAWCWLRTQPVAELLVTVGGYTVPVPAQTPALLPIVSFGHTARAHTLFPRVPEVKGRSKHIIIKNSLA